MRVEKYLYRKLEARPHGGLSGGGVTAPEHFTPFVHPDRAAAELHADALASREAELMQRFEAHLQQTTAEAHARGYAEGRDAGVRESKQEADTRVQQAVSAHDLALAKTLEKLGGAFGEILQAEQQKQRVTIADVAKLAMAIGRKIAGRALAINGADTLEAQLREVMASLHGEPQVVVRTAPALQEAARGKLEEAARVASFRGNLVVEADATMQPGDGVIHWGHGTAVRDTNALLDAAERIVDRYLAAEETAGAAQTGTPPEAITGESPAAISTDPAGTGNAGAGIAEATPGIPPTSPKPS